MPLSLLSDDQIFEYLGSEFVEQELLEEWDKIKNPITDFSPEKALKFLTQTFVEISNYNPNELFPDLCDYHTSRIPTPIYNKLQLLLVISLQIEDLIKHHDTIHFKKATAEMKEAKDINDSQTLEVNTEEWLISIDTLQKKREELHLIYKSLFKFESADKHSENGTAIDNLEKFFAVDASLLAKIPTYLSMMILDNTPILLISRNLLRVEYDYTEDAVITEWEKIKEEFKQQANSEKAFQFLEDTFKKIAATSTEEIFKIDQDGSSDVIQTTLNKIQLLKILLIQMEEFPQLMKNKKELIKSDEVLRILEYKLLVEQKKGKDAKAEISMELIKQSENVFHMIAKGVMPKLVSPESKKENTSYLSRLSKFRPSPVEGKRSLEVSHETTYPIKIYEGLPEKIVEAITKIQETKLDAKKKNELIEIIINPKTTTEEIEKIIAENVEVKHKDETNSPKLSP